MFKWLRKTQSPKGISRQQIISLHRRLRLIVKSYTPVAGTNTRDFNFEYVCRECGGYLVDIADKANDDSLVNCTACGQQFGSLALVKALANEVGLTELEKRSLGHPSVALPVLDIEVDTAPDSDVIAGWQLCVTMQRRTPLEWLLRHREFHPGASKPIEAVPMQHAIWVPTSFSFRYKKIDLDEPADATMASEIGYIPASGGDFLPFLIEYRKTVECDLSGQFKLDGLKVLGDIFPKYRNLCVPRSKRRFY